VAIIGTRPATLSDLYPPTWLTWEAIRGV